MKASTSKTGILRSSFAIDSSLKRSKSPSLWPDRLACRGGEGIEPVRPGIAGNRGVPMVTDAVVAGQVVIDGQVPARVVAHDQVAVLVRDLDGVALLVLARCQEALDETLVPIGQLRFHTVRRVARIEDLAGGVLSRMKDRLVGTVLVNRIGIALGVLVRLGLVQALDVRARPTPGNRASGRRIGFPSSRRRCGRSFEGGRVRRHQASQTPISGCRR